MRNLVQSTAANIVVFMTDSSDHVSGKTGLTLTITASKNGAAFASITPTVTELANGWYSLALTTTHTNTLGDLAFHITGTGADPTDFVDRVMFLAQNVAGAPVVDIGYVGGTTATTATTVDANVTQLLGTAWLTPGTAGTPDVNVKYFGGVVQRAVDLWQAIVSYGGHR